MDKQINNSQAKRPRGRPVGTSKGGRTQKSRTITIDDERWSYAEQQPGGASEFFRNLIDKHRADTKTQSES